MNKELFKLFIIIWIGKSFQRTLAATKLYYMEDQCGRIIDLFMEDTTAASVQLTSNISYKHNLNCSLQIRAPPGKRLMIRFLNLDIEWSATCSDDYLIIFDGQGLDREAVHGLQRRICGYVAPRNIYTASHEIVTLKFRSNAYSTDEGFHILFTAYRSSGSSCYANEYQCRASLRCIEKNLQFDQYDNCGDGSDECWTVSGAIIGGIIGTSVAVCLLIGLVIFCCSKRVKKPAIEKEKRAYTSGSPGNITCPGYSPADISFTVTKPPSYSQSYSSRNAPSQIWITVPSLLSHGGVTKPSYNQTKP